jgi:hypothetical protein
MDEKFREHIESLDEKYQNLMNMAPLTIGGLEGPGPTGGVYLFSEGKKHIYAGRTKRSIHERLKEHVGKSRDCPLAKRITRKKTDKKKRSDGTWDALFKDKNLYPSGENFEEIYEESKNRIKRMDVRYVEETDPIKQALLEIYVAVVENTEYNDFTTS